MNNQTLWAKQILGHLERKIVKEIEGDFMKNPELRKIFYQEYQELLINLSSHFVKVEEELKSVMGNYYNLRRTEVNEQKEAMLNEMNHNSAYYFVINTVEKRGKFNKLENHDMMLEEDNIIFLSYLLQEYKNHKKENQDQNTRELNMSYTRFSEISTADREALYTAYIEQNNTNNTPQNRTQQLEVISDLKDTLTSLVEDILCAEKNFKFHHHFIDDLGLYFAKILKQK